MNKGVSKVRELIGSFSLTRFQKRERHEWRGKILGGSGGSDKKVCHQFSLVRRPSVTHLTTGVFMKHK